MLMCVVFYWLIFPTHSYEALNAQDQEVLVCSVVVYNEDRFTEIEESEGDELSGLAKIDMNKRGEQECELATMKEDDDMHHVSVLGDGRWGKEVLAIQIIPPLVSYAIVSITDIKLSLVYIG